MTTMAAIQRSSPAFTTSATQQTAPVHEFRCLYTRDLHKKAKKWHDGSLRFHTFNRRVMVYDDAKNYIGDLHYRQEEDFGEGVEIQLDRGVKVEVGEQLGETQTDLAPLLDRRKPEDGADKRSPLQPKMAITQRLSATATQQRPKSLADVLGASQGQRGRAQVPLQSPYEQRRSLQEVQPREPPAKRQRTALGKENGPRPVQTRRGNLEPPLQRAKAPVLPRSSVQVIEFAEVVDLSSDEEAAKSRARLKKSAKGTKSQAASAVSRCQLQQHPASPVTGMNGHLTKTQDAPVVETASRKSKSVTRLRSEPQLSAGSARSQLLLPSAPGRTALLLSAQPPRRKLMYEALLPASSESRGSPSATTNPASIAKTVLREHSQRFDVSKSSRETRKSPGLHTDLSQVFSSQDTSDVRQTPPKQHPSPGHVEASPLFVPREDDISSPSRSAISSRDDFVVPSPNRSQPLQPQTVGHSVRRIEDRRQIHETKSIRTRSSVKPGAQRDQSRMLPPQPPVGPHETQDRKFRSPQVYPIRRVLSENDAITHEIDDDFLAPSAVPSNGKVPLVMPKLKLATSCKQMGPAKLRRSVSDTSALELVNEPEPQNPVPLEDVGETGAWSSVEAFLLFDWWPPDRVKPDFGQAAHHSAATLYGRGPHCFTSASNLLRDDPNVL